MSEEREERLAKNETLFRLVNESILGLAVTLSGTDPYEFVCECGTAECFERLRLTLPEYEAVRQDGAHFVLAPGHEDIEVEQVIEDHGSYIVVEKDGVAGLFAEAENPRG